MPLAMEGTRVLSPLERDAVNLVFQGTIDPRDIALEIIESVPEKQGAKYTNVETRNGARVAVSAYYGSGTIRISRSALPHTQALNINSTRRYLDLNDKRGELTNQFRPGNMHYLSTLIHECTHYWQEEFNRHAFKGFNKPPVYDFMWEQLKQRDVPDLSPEQHASAVQVSFLSDWQSKHQPKGADVNLTSRSKDPAENVGPVDRLLNIDGTTYILRKGTSRSVKYRYAPEWIASNFGWLLVELRYGWKAVCQGTESFSRKKRVHWASLKLGALKGSI